MENSACHSTDSIPYQSGARIGHEGGVHSRFVHRVFSAVFVAGQVLASAPVAILAGAAEVKRFPATQGLPLKRIRGQITQLEETAQTAVLKTVVCAEGYVAPGRLGEHTLGASFDFHNDDLTTTPAGHQSNLDLLQEISTDLVEHFGGR